MMIKNYLRLFLLCFPATQAFAQNLTVQVYTHTPKTPIAAALVIINEEITLTTDAHGQVMFPDVSFPLTLKVLASDFQRHEEKLESPQDHKIITLTPLVETQQGLEVTADRIQEKTSKIQIKQEELRQIPGSFGDPLRALTALPGVTAANQGGGGGGLYIRGSDAGDNGIWINRLPVGYLYHDSFNSTINPALVKDFNIFLAGAPVEYPDHVGGFIDVKLRPPQRDRLHHSYLVALNEASFLVEGPIGETNAPQGFIVAGRRSYLDQIISPDTLNKQLRGDSNDGETNEIITIPTYYDFQGIYMREYAQGSLQLQYLNASDKLSLNNNTTKYSDPELAGTLQHQRSYHSLGLNLNHTLNERWNFIAALGWLYTEESSFFGRNAQSGLPYFQKNLSRQTLLQPEFQAHYSHGLLHTGVELQYNEYPLDLYLSQAPAEDDFDFNFTLAEKYRLTKTLYAHLWSPYVKYQHHFGAKLKTTIGVGYSQVKGSGGIDITGTTPQISLEYQWSPDVIFTALWGQYQQLPTQTSQLIPGLGNPRLNFIKAEHRILGTQIKLNPQWKLLLEAYDKPLSDLSIAVPDAAPPDNFANKGTGKIYGLDVFLKREINQRRGGWLSYSFNRSFRSSELNNESRRFSGDVPHTLTLVWKQPFWGSFQDWDWGIKFQTHTGAPFTPVTGRTAYCFSNNNYAPCANQSAGETQAGFSHYSPIYGAHNEKRLPVYYKLDLRVEKTIHHNDSTVIFFVDMNNVLFTQQVLGYDYGNKYERITNPKKVTGLPFLPFLGVELKF